MTVISISALTKTFKTFSRREGILGGMRDLFQRDYKTLKAVDAISFQVQKGELLGYIGPNGAGKSTSIKMLTGILKPTSGEMNVLGFHPFRDRKAYTQHIGVVFGQRTQLWWDIAVLESLKLLGKIYAVEPSTFTRRLDELSAILDIGKLLHTPVRKLSLGQRIRCDLAASLIHKPQILFLDEPTIGLDAVGKDATREFLRRINREFGTTIILTTHDLNEIEELCKRMVIIDKGKIIYNGSIAHIKSLPGLERSLLMDFSGPAPLERLSQKFGEKITLHQEGERRLRAQFDPKVLPTVELIREVVGSYDVADFTVSDPNIEEVVMKIYREGIATAENR
jgi:ABC-2 type transport system ATP-binding protein